MDRWTQLHRSRPWDAIQGYTRSPMAALFVSSFQGSQQTMRFGNRQHSRDEAYLLAAAWSAIMTFLFNMWESNSYNPLEYSADDLLGHDELELVDAMLQGGEDSAVWTRGAEIRSIVPGAFIDE